MIFFRNFERAFTPRTWLRSARNFGKTRFKRFASFHFLTLNFFEIFFQGFDFFSKKVAFWRSYEAEHVTGRCALKSYCLKCPYFWGEILGEGVNDSICVFDLDLAPKMTLTMWAAKPRRDVRTGWTLCKR